VSPPAPPSSCKGFDVVLNQKSGAVSADAAGPLKLVWVSVSQSTAVDGSIQIKDTVATITGGTLDGNVSPSAGGVINAYSATGLFSVNALTVTGAKFTNNQVVRVGMMLGGCARLLACAASLLLLALYPNPLSLSIHPLLCHHTSTRAQTAVPSSLPTCAPASSTATSLQTLPCRTVAPFPSRWTAMLAAPKHCST